MINDKYSYTLRAILAVLLIVATFYFGNSALFYSSAGNFPSNEQQTDILQQRFLLLAGLSVVCLLSFFMVMVSIVKKANKYRSDTEN